MEYDYIVYPKTKNLRGVFYAINGYLIFEDHLEVDLIKDDRVVKVICDLDSFEKLKNYYWCVAMVGRDGYKSPSIYCNINRIKYRLKDILYPKYIGKTIEFINNNCLDFRSNNIRVLNGISKKESRNYNNKKGLNLPVGIVCVTDKYNNKTVIIGYDVRNNTPYHKYFGVKKFKTQKAALKAALDYYKKINKLL